MVIARVLLARVPCALACAASSLAIRPIRAGLTDNETLLTTSSLNSHFGKLFAMPVDGHAYTQPLVAGKVGARAGAPASASRGCGRTPGDAPALLDA